MSRKIKYQIDLICSKDELRPALTGVLIDNGNAVATDGNVLVIMGLKYMRMDYLESFNGKIIKADIFKKIGNAKFDIDVQDGNLIIDGKTIENIFIDARFPDYKAVLPKENKGVDMIGIDGSNLDRIQKAFNSDSLVLSFTGQNKAMSIKPNTYDFDDCDFQAICMPKMSIEEKPFTIFVKSSELQTA